MLTFHCSIRMTSVTSLLSMKAQRLKRLFSGTILGYKNYHTTLLLALCDDEIFESQ